MEEARRELDSMPYDKEYNGRLIHATGDEVMLDGEWWDEYQDEQGNLFYGR